MAKLRELEVDLSKAMGMPLKSVRSVSRKLREAGMLPDKTAVQNGGVDVSLDDAVNLLLGLMLDGEGVEACRSAELNIEQCTGTIHDEDQGSSWRFSEEMVDDIPLGFRGRFGDALVRAMEAREADDGFEQIPGIIEVSSAGSAMLSFALWIDVDGDGEQAPCTFELNYGQPSDSDHPFPMTTTRSIPLGILAHIADLLKAEA